MKSKNLDKKRSDEQRRLRSENWSKSSAERLEKAFDACRDVTKYRFTRIEQLKHSFGPDVLPMYFAIDVERGGDADKFEDWDVICEGDSKSQFESWVKLGGIVEVSYARCSNDTTVVRLETLEEKLSCFGISHPPDEYGLCLWLIDTDDVQSVKDLRMLLRGDKSSHTGCGILSARLHLAHVESQ